MCLCMEIRKSGSSFVDYAEMLGVDAETVERLRAWEEKTPCYCHKMDAHMMRELAKRFNLWAAVLDSAERIASANAGHP